MILYFTGTGNSRYAAKLISQALNDSLVSLNECMKANNPGNFHSETPFVIVSPTYMSRMPLAVEQFIENSSFSGNKKLYFVLTAGASVGNAHKYCQKLCSKKFLSYMGTASVAMPANYVVMYDVTPKENAREEAKKADAAILKIADDIKYGKILYAAPSMGGHKAFSAISPLFNSIMVSAKGFRANEKCTGCGTCSNICPRNNIHLTNGKPVWEDSCIHCMACISACPQTAINYGKKTVGRNRYYLNS